MGYRIELGEIEVVLGTADSVEEVAVILVKEGDGRLVAAVAASVEMTEDELLDHADKYLPAYMVPKEIHFFDELPKNVNGKIDQESDCRFSFKKSNQLVIKVVPRVGK